jgi:hypothetical protein
MVSSCELAIELLAIELVYSSTRQLVYLKNFIF